MEFLFVDTPPGTSDEHLSIVQYMADAGIFLPLTPGANLTKLSFFRFSDFRC